MTGMRSFALGLALAGWMSCAGAGTASARFSVGIVLHGMSAGVCVSRSLSDAAGAIVKVDCDSNQFVSIEPDPGRPFLGSMSSIKRMWFGLVRDNASTGSELLQPLQASSLSMSRSLVRVTYETSVAAGPGAASRDTPLTASVIAYRNAFGSPEAVAELARGVSIAGRSGAPVQMLIGF
jgi:hypothetical protein